MAPQLPSGYWVGPGPLFMELPNLFKIESKKLCMVNERITNGSHGPVYMWDWARPISGGVEQEELQRLINIVSIVTIGMGKDKFKWNYDDSGDFRVADIKRYFSIFNRSTPISSFVWNNWVPKKVGIVSWSAEKDRLPTRCALARRSVNVPDLLCLFCSEHDETGEHLFVSCQFAQIIWQNIATWCKIPSFIAFDFKDILNMHGYNSGSWKKKKVLNAIFLVTVWCIWKARNEAMFNSVQPSVTKILDEVKSMAFLWIKNRSRDETITWENWRSFNIFS
ncbi:uncharacterized protein LOC110869590 [Helianthus annuus]|uniref:uncharacterized protein LOC110869590 n=1 Tax=Helianthus annuus TaxID=4232 RepID=UPI000B903C96|nr:uncharacterized protein LOC110869590 [Helianthus annuus]